MIRNTLYNIRIPIENTYPAMIGITDDQGAMCFLGSVIAIKSQQCFIPIIGRAGIGFLIKIADHP